MEGFIKHNFTVFIVEDAIKEVSLIEKNKLFSVWKKKGVRFLKTSMVLNK